VIGLKAVQFAGLELQETQDAVINPGFDCIAHEVSVARVHFDMDQARLHGCAH